MDLTAPLAALQAEQSRTILGGNHAYRRDGTWKPGCTSILKTLDAPRLDDWRVEKQVEGTARAAYRNQPLQWEPEDGYVSRLARLGEEQYEADRIADEAAKIGNDVHALIEHHIRRELGQPMPDPVVCDEALARFAAWKRWAREMELTPLAAEARVYNSILDYCGTLDALVLVAGEPTVLDWKASPALYPNRRLQSAAYRAALVSMGWPPLRGAIVCVPRDGSEVSMLLCDEPGDDLDAAVEAFGALLMVYRWQKAVEKRERSTKKAAA
jgi:hypothetical protein